MQGKGTRGTKGDATRKTLLDAALRVIAKKGYSSATIDAIVKEAGVSKGLVYYHFKNKAAIGSAVLEEGLDTLLTKFEAAAAESKDALDGLRAIFDVFIDSVVDNRAFGEFFVAELWRGGRVWSDDMRAEEDRLVHIISNQFKRGQLEGVIDPNADTEFDATACIGLVLTTALAYFDDEHSERSMSKEEFSKRVQDFVSNAMIVRTNRAVSSDGADRLLAVS